MPTTMPTTMPSSLPKRTTVSFPALAVCATVGALGAAAFLAAAPARADQADYVSYLNDNGVAYRNLPAVIALGNDNVCRPLRDGGGIDSVIGEVVDSGYTGEETAYIIIGAIRYMCPDQLPTLQGWRVQHSAPAESVAGQTI